MRKTWPKRGTAAAEAAGGAGPTAASTTATSSERRIPPRMPAQHERFLTNQTDVQAAPRSGGAPARRARAVVARARHPAPRAGGRHDAHGVAPLRQTAQVDLRAQALAAHGLDTLAVDVDARVGEVPALGLAQADAEHAPARAGAARSARRGR